MGLLSKISAVNFRNYSNLNLDLSIGINVLVGANGHGKTNILEAIYFLSLLRSFRSYDLKHLIKWHEKAFRINGVIGHTQSTTRLNVQFGDTRSLSINGSTIAKASEFIGRIQCVPFVSEDISLINGNGSYRRKFIDITLSQIYPDYLVALQNYNKAIKSRNKLLKSDRIDYKAIEAFDSILAVAGAQITSYRYNFCDKMNEILAGISNEMLGTQDNVLIRYKLSYEAGPRLDSVADYQDAFSNALKSNISKDSQYKFTTVGPHRDDLMILFNDKSLFNFGSEGQCRISVLVLKMAVGKFLSTDGQKHDIIYLVDDVMGELDEIRSRSFLESLTQVSQVFITATEKQYLDVLQPSAVYSINEGIVDKSSK